MAWKVVEDGQIIVEAQTVSTKYPIAKIKVINIKHAHIYIIYMYINIYICLIYSVSTHTS